MSSEEESEIFAWLRHLKLPDTEYAPMLIDDGWEDLESLSEASEEDLTNCGIKKTGHRRKMVKFLQKDQFMKNLEKFYKEAGINKKVFEQEEKEIQSKPESSDMEVQVGREVVPVEEAEAQTDSATTFENSTQTKQVKRRAVAIQVSSALAPTPAPATNQLVQLLNTFLTIETSTSSGGQERLILELKKTLITSLVLLQGDDVQTFMQTKFHPIDLKSMATVMMNPETMAAKLVQNATNTQLQELITLLSCATAQIQSIKSVQDHFGNPHWTIVKVSTSADDETEELYKSEWRATFVMDAELLVEKGKEPGEADKKLIQKLDGISLVFRYFNNKWYLCNF